MPIGCKCDGEFAALKAEVEKLKRDVSDMQRQQQLQQQQTGPVFSEQTSSDLDELHSLLTLLIRRRALLFIYSPF